MAKSRYPMKALAAKWRRPFESDDVVVCRICDQQLVNARILPCLHVFCEDCLILLLKTYQQLSKLDRTFFCPVCKVRTPCHLLGKVSEKWAELFPRKESVDRLKEACTVVEEICTPCHKSLRVSQASSFCRECQAYMCVPCESKHRAVNKQHTVLDYKVKEMKTTPVSNVSKFQCKIHSNLRITTYCETHAVFLCNTCRETDSVHRSCKLSHSVVDLTAKITRAETKINTVNSLKRDERNKGKQLLKLIEQLHGIQTRLQAFREKQEQRYCRYVTEAIITEQKTEAMDALKGKVEFDKSYRTDDAIFRTMNKVEEIVTGYAHNLMDEDERTIKADIHKSVGEMEKILEKNIFDVPKPSELPDTKECDYTSPDKQKPHELAWMRDQHVCKKHVTDSIDEESIQFYGAAMESVGTLVYHKMSATAFRVGSKYVMTAAHTVRDIVDPDRTGRPDWAALEDNKHVYITFDSPPTPNSRKFGFHKLAPFLDETLNIAILEVRDIEGLPPPLVLCMKDVNQLGVSEVTVIGYGLPGSYKKHINIRCNLIGPDSHRAKQALSWLKTEEKMVRCRMLVKGKDPSSINWNYDEMKKEDIIAIDCCLEYRALGSPVLIKYGNLPHPVVVAMFTHSSPDCFYELPKRAQLEYKDFRFELATTVNSFHDFLVIERRVLADDIFVKDKNYFERESSFEALLKHAK